MNWYFKVLGGHTHVRVFMNGGRCGDLCFRNEEFTAIQLASSECEMLMPNGGHLITFIDEGSHD